MADSIPNIVVPAETVVNIYTDAEVVAAGLVVGDKIGVLMIGTGDAKLYSGATLATEPDDATGYRPITSNEEMFNSDGDLGAFIWSRHGCTINVGVA